MANVTIGSLTAVSTVNSSDVIPIVQGGVTKRATVSQLPTSTGAPGDANGVYNAANNSIAVGATITTALQNLINTVSTAGGGTISITAPGVYFCEAVDLKSNITLNIGMGVVLRYPNGSTAAKMLNIPNGVTNVTVNGPGAIDGNRANYSGNTTNGGDLFYNGTGAVASSIRVVGVTFQNAPRNGICTYESLTDFTVERCRFISARLHATLAYNTTSVRWLDCHIDRTADTIAANTPTMQYWANPNKTNLGPIIRGNEIIAPTGTGSENAFIGIEVHADNTSTPAGRIIGGTVADNKTYGGSMGLSLVNCEGLSATGNTIRHTDFCGIEIAGGTGVIVDGNTYDGENVGSGIRVNNTVDLITISNNRIANVADSYSAGGIHSNTQLLSGATVVGNTVTGSYSKLSAIYFNNISDSVIADNVIRVEATGSGLYYIDLRGNAANVDDNIVHDNIIQTRSGAYSSNGHISIKTSGTYTASRNLIHHNNIQQCTGGSGNAVNLAGTATGSIIGTTVRANVVSGPFSNALSQSNTTGTLTD